LPKLYLKIQQKKNAHREIDRDWKKIGRVGKNSR